MDTPRTWHAGTHGAHGRLVAADGDRQGRVPRWSGRPPGRAQQRQSISSPPPRPRISGLRARSCPLQRHAASSAALHPRRCTLTAPSSTALHSSGSVIPIGKSSFLVTHALQTAAARAGPGVLPSHDKTRSQPPLLPDCISPDVCAAIPARPPALQHTTPLPAPPACIERSIAALRAPLTS
jgi:hypothetical protein